MSKFLLLLGPTGVGKSTVIEELCKLDGRFTFISPFMTRPLRQGEKGKVFVSDAEMDAMLHRGDFLAVNQFFGVRYATPRLPIAQAFAEKRFPVLDWPAEEIQVMLKAFPGQTHVVYLAPPSLEVLRQRLAVDARDVKGDRFQFAQEELEKFWSGKYDAVCDFKFVTVDQEVPENARLIYVNFLNSF